MNLDSWKIKNTLEKSEHLKFYQVLKVVQKKGSHQSYMLED